MTAVSSNSSEVDGGAEPDAGNAAGSARPLDAGLPLVELRDVGVWYQLHRKPIKLKQALLGGRGQAPRRVLWALRHVHLACYRGQTVGVIGRNGAGKSTLCSVLAQILTADEGQVTIRGRVTPLLGLGTGFNNDLTGRSNIFLYSAFLGIPRREVIRKLDDIIAFSELDEFIDEPIFTYSTGMRSRLGFSVAAMLEPEILILDEVLGTGDRAFRAKSRARILQMMRQSKLIVIVSHSSAFLRKTCSHCLWLERGQAMMYGEARAVVKAYEAALDDGKAPAIDVEDDDEV